MKKPLICLVINHQFSNDFDIDKNIMEVIENDFTEELLDFVCDKDINVNEVYKTTHDLFDCVRKHMNESSKEIPTDIKCAFYHMIDVVRALNPDDWRSVDAGTRRGIKNLLVDINKMITESTNCDLAEIAYNIELVCADEQREIDFVNELNDMSKEELIEMIKKQKKQ